MLRFEWSLMPMSLDRQNAPPRPIVTVLAWVPVVAFLLVAVGLDVFSAGEAAIGGLWLVPALNLIFGTAASLLVTLLSARRYLEGGSSANLCISAATAVFGIGSMVAGLEVPAARFDFNVTIHNCAACLAGACNLAAAVRLALTDPAGRSRRQAWVRLAVLLGAVLLAMAAIIWATYRRVLPPFFVEGQGPTALRQLVLSVAVAEFALSAILLRAIGGSDRSAFLRWYGLALALIAIGLEAVYVNRQFTSVHAWVGRSAQYAGGLYLLAAAAGAVRRSRRLRAPLELLRETEMRYSRLVDLVPDGVLIHSEGRCVFANRAAVRLFGASSAHDLVGRPVSSLLHPNERRSMEAPPDAGADKAPREIQLVRLDGRPIQTEISGSRVDYMANPAMMTVIRDVSTRRARELALRVNEERLNRQNSTLVGINRILAEALTCETEEALGRVCLDVAEEVTSSRFGFLGEVNARGTFDDIAVSDPGWAACTMEGPTGHGKPITDLPVHGIYGRVLLDGKGFYTNKTDEHPDRVGLPEGHPPITAFLGVPFVQAGRTIGMVAVGNREGGYRDEDLQALEALAPVMVQAFMRNRAERALRDREHELRTIMDAAPGLIAYVGPDVRYRRVNRTYEEWFGRSADEIRGMHSRDLLGEEAWNGIRPYVERALAGEKVSYEQELTFGGRKRWAQGTYMPDLDEAGRVRGFVVHVVDIGRRKAAEAAVRSGEALYRTIARNIPDGAVRVVGPDLRYLAVEGSLLASLGLSREMLEGREVREAPGEQAGSMEERFRRALGGASDGYESEYRGRMLWTQYVPLRDEGGRVSAAMAMTLDITERTQAERDLLAAKEEAERASRAKSEFLAHMSHELRTPISAIVGLSEVLEPRIHDEEARQFVALIQASAKSLLSIIGNILDLSYVESGKVQLRLSRIELRPLLENLVSTYSVIAGQKGLSLTLRVGDGVPPVVDADPEPLSRVLTNLLSNALKYTEAGGVRISVDLDERLAGREFLRLAVTDTGVGIPASSRHRLFESFERLHGSVMRPSHQGTGLGLAISKRLVELMGGSIGAESEEGVGSTFFFTLPTHPAETPRVRAPAPAPAAAGRPLSRLHPLKLLLVEDNFVNRLFLKTAFEDSGHVVTTAANGAQALAALGQSAFDAVLMDIQMPGMDGLEATRRIRALPGERARVPVIALTAFAVKGDAGRFEQAGLDDYVTKPVDFEQLVTAIERLCPTARGRI